MRAVNADDLIHELDKDGIVEHGYVSVFGIPIIEDCVPVVRCKDCKYRPKKDGYFNDFCPCATTGDPYLDWIPEDDWYCASGEKVEQ